MQCSLAFVKKPKPVAPFWSHFLPVESLYCNRFLIPMIPPPCTQTKKPEQPKGIQKRGDRTGSLFPCNPPTPGGEYILKKDIKTPPKNAAKQGHNFVGDTSILQPISRLHRRACHRRVPHEVGRTGRPDGLPMDT
jgi:hypothetical protein